MSCDVMNWFHWQRERLVLKVYNILLVDSHLQALQGWYRILISLTRRFLGRSRCARAEMLVGKLTPYLILTINGSNAY